MGKNSRKQMGSLPCSTRQSVAHIQTGSSFVMIPISTPYDSGTLLSHNSKSHYSLVLVPRLACVRSFSVQSQLALGDGGDVAAAAQELHHLLARSGHLRPAGSCFGVLLEPSNLAPIDNEVDLPQPFFRRFQNAIALPAKLDHARVLNKHLPPNIDHCFFE